MLLDKGINLWLFNKEILKFSKKLLVDEFKTSPFKLEAARVAGLSLKWMYLSARLAIASRINMDNANSAAVDYLHFSGYVTMAHFWLRMMDVASKKLAANPTGPDADFYKGKIATGKFYFGNLLPRTKAFSASMLQKPSTVMSITQDQMFTR